MAVYTQVSTSEIAALTARLGLGRAVAFDGVAEGVENSTFFLTCEQASGIRAEYVLTIAETVSAVDLRFVVDLMVYLKSQQVPVAAPLLDTAGNGVLTVGHKPALVVPRLAGKSPNSPGSTECSAIGSALGRMHGASLAYGLNHQSHRSLGWVFATATLLKPCLHRLDEILLSEEVNHALTLVNTNSNLPQAVIHGDLFKDNALFLKDKISGIIDFFSAGTGFLMLDLAIVVNDWTYDAVHLKTLVSSYSAHRSPTSDEKEFFHSFLRLAALRFWISRLAEKHLSDGNRPRGVGKNPDEYRNLLLERRDRPCFWPLH